MKGRAMGKPNEGNTEVLRKYETALPVPLSPETRLAKSIEMSGYIMRVDETDADLRDYRGRIREEQASLQGKISLLAHQVNTGTEEQDIECEDVADWVNNEVCTYRVDTGEMIETRSMTQNERQKTLSIV
jgi:hypothetical protein